MQCHRKTNQNHLDAERMNAENEFEDDVAYSVHLLKVRAEFEVKIVSCGVGW